MRKFLLLLATVIWVAFWWWWYTCKICETCFCYQAQIPIETPLLKETGVILFNQNDSIPLTQVGWPKFRDSLSQILDPSVLLEIEGQYFEDETNHSYSENLGLARANAILKLFPDSLIQRIKLASLKTDKRPGIDQYPFVASSFSIKPASENIVEIGDKTLIYFKPNSNQRIQDKEIETFLNQLAAKHKSDRAVINITGFTDDSGSEKNNIKMGLSRAKVIRDYLIKKGIEADRIHIFSKGEDEPIANNNTPLGRQKNRRTEIEIIEKL